MCIVLRQKKKEEEEEEASLDPYLICLNSKDKAKVMVDTIY